MKKLVASLLCVGVLGVVSASAQDPSAGPFTTVTEITVTGIADVDSLRFDADNLDVMLARGGANRLELADGDSFRLINGTFQFGGGDGVAVTEDGDGAITFTGEGNGSDENLTWNYDDTANTVVISSSSGVTNLTYTSIGATFGAALSVSSGVVTISDSSAGALDVGGGLNIGTGNVALVGTDGRINGPLSSTNIDDLSGANLTTLNASNLSSGTVATARLGSGTASSSTFLRGDGAWTSVTAGPGGSDTQVQFNDGGTLEGDSGFVFDKDANSVDITGTGADALDVGGGLNIGSGNVALVGTDGKISGPLSSTIIDDLSGANLTSLNAGNISSGTLAVARGGTGAASLTDGGLLFGSGTGAITALGVATNGQIPIGDGTTDPQLATISGTSNEIEITNGSASITVGIPASATITTALTISGTGASSLDIGGGLNAGTGDVALVGDDGRINGPLSSTIIDDLSAANLTSIPAGQLTGSIANARLPTNIDVGGTLDVTGATTLDSTLALVGAVTFNDAGGDVDIRAEGDSVTNLFTLDASTDRIGIGITAPANILHVVQTGADWGMFIDSSSTSYAPGIQLRPNGTAKGWVSATNAGALLLDGNTIVVVNEGSADKDFRIESDDNANMLVVDGGDDRVGIGKASPTVTLDVNGVTNINGHLNTLAENDLRLQDNSGGEYVGFDAPATVSGSYTMTLPAAIGSVNQMLTINNTDGTLQWATPSTFDTDAAQIFNDSGNDVDFRIEADDNANILFVDGAGTGKVGIGSGSPETKLFIPLTATAIASGFDNVDDWAHQSIFVDAIGANSTSTALAFKHYTAGYEGSAGGTAIISGRGAAGWDTFLAFATNVSESSGEGALREQMRIEPGGTVTFKGGTLGTGGTEVVLNNGNIVLADDAAMTLTINTAAIVMVQWQDDYNACAFFLSYGSATVVELADPSGTCLTSDGSSPGIRVFKASGTHLAYVKNTIGFAEEISVQVIHGRGQ